MSAYINFENFVIPVLRKMNGETGTAVPVVDAVISRRLVSSLKHREYVRVKVGRVDGKVVASPLARGAGAAHESGARPTASVSSPRAARGWRPGSR